MNIALFVSASLRLCGVLLFAFLLAGCLTTPVDQSGGLGSVTVTNSNPTAITAAAQSVFPNYGYTCHSSKFYSVSFDKNSNQFANIMWGSYDCPQTLRVKVTIIPIPGTNDYRISPKVYTVSDKGEAGFQSKRALSRLWGSEFGPLLKQISQQASGAGGF